MCLGAIIISIVGRVNFQPFCMFLMLDHFSLNIHTFLIRFANLEKIDRKFPFLHKTRPVGLAFEILILFYILMNYHYSNYSTLSYWFKPNEPKCWTQNIFFKGEVMSSCRNKRMLNIQEKDLWIFDTTTTIWTKRY